MFVDKTCLVKRQDPSMADSKVMTTKLLPAFRDLLSMELFNLRTAGFLLSLELELLDVFPGVADALASGLEGAIGVTLGSLGREDALASLDDGRVHVHVATAVAVAEGAVEKAATVARAVSAGRGGVVRRRGHLRAVGGARRRRRWRSMPDAAEKAMSPSLFLFHNGRRGGLPDGFAVAGEERHW